MLVSVIIPVFNYARYLGDAIESVLAQTYRHVEIIVVDDGSTDHTASVARLYNEVRYIYQDNQGVAAARNTGLAAAKGDLIAFIDADDTWHRDKIKLQVEYLRQHPATGFTITKIKNVVEPGATYPPAVMQNILKEDQIGLATIVARREVFDQVGGFDPRYRVAEDFEWFTRAKDMGIKMAILPETLLLRRVHQSNISLRQSEACAARRLQIFRESIERQRRKKNNNNEKG